MARTKKEATEKYIVVKPNTLKHEVGDVVELTERQSKTLIGKVKKQSEVAAGKDATKDLSELKKANAELIKANEDLASQVADLKEKLAISEAALEEAKKSDSE